VRGAVLDRPVFQRAGDDVADRRIERLALGDGAPERAIDILWQARPLRFVVERQGTELFARLPVREGVAAGCRAPPADASNSFGC
jgi:hypothetical protein